MKITPMPVMRAYAPQQPGQDPEPPQDSLPPLDHVVKWSGTWAAVGAAASLATGLVYQGGGDLGGFAFQLGLGLAGAGVGAALLGEKFGGGNGGKAVGALMGLPVFFLTIPGGNAGLVAGAITGAVVGAAWGAMASTIIPE